MFEIEKKYKYEIAMKETPFPIAAKYIQEIFINLKEISEKLEDQETAFEYLLQHLELVKQKIEKDNIPLFRYCEPEYIKDYKIHIYNEQLSFLLNDNFVPVDTVNLFKKHFELRTPLEDEQYVKSFGIEIIPARVAKSEESVFIVRTDGIYISPYRCDTMQHTFIEQKKVLSAGTIRVNDGKIVLLDNRSGHFKTSPESIQVFFDFLFKLNQNKAITNLFISGFDIDRIEFSSNNRDRLAKKEYGVKLGVYDGKIFQDKLEKIRKSIGRQYFL